jgi:hypothetical protein
MKQILECLPRKVIAPPAPTSQGKLQTSFSSIINQDFPYIKAYAKSKGLDVMEIPTGYRVFKWGLFKDVSTLVDLDNFINQIGGQ